MEITKDTKIAEIIAFNLMSLFVLKKFGMLCANCPVKNNDTIEACAKVHGVNLEKLINELNKTLK